MAESGLLPRLLSEVTSLLPHQSILSLLVAVPLTAIALEPAQPHGHSHVYAATQSGHIHAWLLSTLSPARTLFNDSRAAVLTMVVVSQPAVALSPPEKSTASPTALQQRYEDHANWLIASSADGTIRVRTVPVSLSARVYILTRRTLLHPSHHRSGISSLHPPCTSFTALGITWAISYHSSG